MGLPLCGLFGPVDSDLLGPLGPVDPSALEEGDSGLVMTVVRVLTNVVTPPGIVEAGMVLPGTV